MAAAEEEAVRVKGEVKEVKKEVVEVEERSEC